MKLSVFQRMQITVAVIALSAFGVACLMPSKNLNLKSSVWGLSDILALIRVAMSDQHAKIIGKICLILALLLAVLLFYTRDKKPWVVRKLPKNGAWKTKKPEA
jgi:hypothetical protein